MSGSAGWILDPEKKVVQDLLVLNIVRGVDSAGIANVDRSNNVTLVRAIGTPFGDHGEAPGLFGLKAFDRLIKMPSKLVLGHNRASTRGEISITNAHPFKFTHIVGAHNGTISHDTVNSLLGSKVYGTDSEALINTIQQTGIEETVPMLKNVGAVVWYDSRDNTLNFYRDNTRTLFYMFSTDKKTMFWSSDPSPLMYALHRQKISIGTEKPYSFPENTFLSFKIPDNTSDKIEEVTRKTIEPKSNVTYYNNSANASLWAQRNSLNSEDDNWWGMGEDYGVTNGERTPVIESARILALGTKEEIEGEYTVVKVDEKTNKIVKSIHPVSKTNLTSKIFQANEKKFLEQYPSLPKTWWSKHVDAFNRVYYNMQDQRWIWFSFNHITNKFGHKEHPHAPPCVPFTKINIDAGGSHCFSYKKVRNAETNKKERLVLYKGFNRVLLTIQKFGELVASGCMNCQRTPEWGNEVHFFNETDFLCEHCNGMSSVVKMVQGLS